MATLVLLSYKRQHVIPKIVESVKYLDFIENIVIWDNNVSKPLSQDLMELDPRISIFSDSKNLGPYGRWHAAINYTTDDTILFQDDDCIVSNYQAIYDEFKSNNSSKLVYCIRCESDRWKKRFKREINEDWALVGWGAAVNREWIIPAMSRYTRVYGKDELFLSKADRIITALMPRKRVMLKADIHNLPESTNRKMAMYLQKNHSTLIHQAARRYKKIIKNKGGKDRSYSTKMFL
jgi:hypothetical protein